MENIMKCLINLKSWEKFDIPTDSIESASSFLLKSNLNLSDRILIKFLLSSEFNFLDFWLQHKCRIQISREVFSQVISKGSVEAFDFLVRSGVNFSEQMIKICFFRCCNLSRFDILERIIKFNFFSSIQSIDFVHKEVPFCLTKYGQTGALEWWKNTFLPHRSDEYLQMVIDQIRDLNFECLRWWGSSELLSFDLMKDLTACFDSKLSSDDFEKIKWCQSKKIKFRLVVPVEVPENGIDTDHSKLYSDNGIFPQITDKYLNSLCDKNKTGELSWIIRNSKYVREGGIMLSHSSKAVDTASNLGHIQILEIWKGADEKWGVPFRYSEKAFILAARNCRMISLDWWLTTKYPIKITPQTRKLSLQVFSRKKKDRKKIEEWLEKVKMKHFETLSSCEALLIFPNELLLELCSFL
nr:ankyrin repeat protein [Pithovirus mammoth]